MGRTGMNRWALQWYADAELWLRERTERLAGRMTTRTAARSDRGQTSFEYLGIVVVIALIIVALASDTDISSKIKDGITNSISKITSAG